MDPGSIFRLITNSTLLATRLLSGQRNDNLYFETFHYCTLVFEDAPITSNVIKVSARHVEGKSVLYNIIGGNQDGLFSVNQITGQVSVAASLDHEVKSEHSLTISAESFDGASSETTVDIVVADVNDNAPEFAVNQLKVHVVEEERLGLPKLLGIVRATDPDWLDQNNLLYTLIGDGVDGYAPEDAFFTINPQTGQITQLKALDRDPPSGKSIWKLRVKAHDGQSNWVTSRILSSSKVVPPKQKRPPQQKPQYGGERNRKMSSFSATHKVLTKGASSYSGSSKTGFTAGGHQSSLNSGDEEGTTNCHLLNSISSPLTKPQETRLKQLLSEITSSQNYVKTSKVNVVETEVLVEVEDINDNPPIFPNTTFYADVQENGPMDLHVAIVTAWDADDPKSPESRLRYYLEQNAVDERNGSPIFRINPDTGEIRTNVCCLDRETTFEYLLQVVATDGGGLKGTGTVAVRLSDVNDNSPRFARPEWQVIIDESQSAGYVDNSTLFEITVSDPDTLNHFLFRVVESSGWGWQFFGIRTSGSKGEVYAKQPLDFEDERQRQGFRFLVEVTDQGNWKDTRIRESTWIVVKLRDANDNDPVFQQSLIHVTIREDIKPHTLIARINAIDPDLNGTDTVDYRLLENWGNLNINSYGEIRTQTAIDREGPFGSKGFVRILAVDRGFPPRSSTATLDIEVLDINDCPPRLIGSAVFHVPENIQPSRVGILLATDDDLWGLGHGPPFTFELDPSNTPFVFENFNLKFMQEIDSGRGGALISTRKTLDREEQRTAILKVSVNDAGNLVSYHDVTVIIDDINDNDMKAASKIAYLWKTQASGDESSIGRVYVDDPDDWDFADKTYDWAEAPNPLFTLNQSTGDIIASSHIREGRYNLRFRVSDLYRGQKDIPANVTVDVRFIDGAIFSHVVALTLSPITSYALTQNWIPFTDEGFLGRLTKFIRTTSDLEIREVEVVSIDDDLHAESNDASSRVAENVARTTIWIAAKNELGRYLDSSKLRGLLEINKNKVESLINIRIDFKEMKYIDLPEKSQQRLSAFSPFALSSSSSSSSIASYLPLYSSSSSRLLYYSNRHQSLSSDFVTLQDVPLKVVDSNRTSLVTPQITQQFFCRRGKYSKFVEDDWIRTSNSNNNFQCNPSTCFNGGKCVPTENGSRCICRGSTWGRHCKLITRSFSSNGFAWFDPVPPCLPLKISLSILAKNDLGGILLYSGPFSNGALEKNQRASFLSYEQPTNLLLLQIKEKKFQLIFEGEFGSFLLELDGKEPLSRQLWSTIHIYVDDQEAFMMTDRCTRNWGSLQDNSSHCLSSVRWKRKSSDEKYPWKVPWQISLPLQVGGLAHEVPALEGHGWKREISHRSFEGCVSKLRINEQIIDLGEPTLSRGTLEGCKAQQFHLCNSESCLPLQFCKDALKVNNETVDVKCFCQDSDHDSLRACDRDSSPLTLTHWSSLETTVSNSSNPLIATFRLKVKTGVKSISLLQLISEDKVTILHLHISNGIVCLEYYKKPSIKERIVRPYNAASHPNARNLSVPSVYQKEIPQNKIQWKIKELNKEIRDNIKPQTPSATGEGADGNKQLNQSVCLTNRFLADGAWHQLSGGRYGWNLELEVDDGDAPGERNESVGFLGLDPVTAKLEPEPFVFSEKENLIIGGVKNPLNKAPSIRPISESESSLCLDEVSVNGNILELTSIFQKAQQYRNNKKETNRNDWNCGGPSPMECKDEISNCSCQMGSTPTSSGCKIFAICDYEPCLHGGTCIPPPDGARSELVVTKQCFCPPSFVGNYCEWKLKNAMEEEAILGTFLALIIAAAIVILAVIGSLIWKYIVSKRPEREDNDISDVNNCLDNQLKGFGDCQSNPGDPEFSPQIVEVASGFRPKPNQVPQLTPRKLKAVAEMNVLSLIIDDSVSKMNDENRTSSRLEDLRTYAYEGDGSSSGSLGSALSDLREEFFDSTEILPLNPITKDIVDLLKDLPDGSDSSLKKKSKIKFTAEKVPDAKISPNLNKLAKNFDKSQTVKLQQTKSSVLLTNGIDRSTILLHM